MNLKLIIIDDELDAIESLELMIQNFIQNAEIVGTARTALDGIKLINQKKPDVVLLDIDMPGGTGFDLLETFPSRDFVVIFTTASSEHAIKALRIKAEDYLLKPIIIEELQLAIDKLSAQVKKPIDENGKIALADLTGYTYVNVKDIIHLKGEGNYTTVYYGNSNKVVSKNIKYFEDLLPSTLFFRCHQSHIVNLKEISELKKNEGLFLVMHNGDKVDVSRAHREEILSMFSF